MTFDELILTESDGKEVVANWKFDEIGPFCFSTSECFSIQVQEKNSSIRKKFSFKVSNPEGWYIHAQYRFLAMVQKKGMLDQLIWPGGTHPFYMFKVTIIENDISRTCKLEGDYYLFVDKESLFLATPERGRPIYMWQYANIHKYVKNEKDDYFAWKSNSSLEEEGLLEVKSDKAGTIHMSIMERLTKSERMISRQTTASTKRSTSLGTFSPSSSLTSAKAIETTCEYWKLCHRFLESLDISKLNVYIQEYNNMCYCMKCHTDRRDNETYERGDPPTLYVLPVGYARFALDIPKKGYALEVFGKWHRAYHGTNPNVIQNILEIGDLLMPGDIIRGGRTLREKDGHYNDDWKPTDFDTRKVFLTPSIKYASFPQYAMPMSYFDEKTGANYEARTVLQVLVCPDSYEASPQTVGDKDYQIDNNFDNNKLEWSTNIRGSLILYGLLINLTKDDDNN